MLSSTTCVVWLLQWLTTVQASQSADGKLRLRSTPAAFPRVPSSAASGFATRMNAQRRSAGAVIRAAAESATVVSLSFPWIAASTSGVPAVERAEDVERDALARAAVLRRRVPDARRAAGAGRRSSLEVQPGVLEVEVALDPPHRVVADPALAPQVDQRVALRLEDLAQQPLVVVRAAVGVLVERERQAVVLRDSACRAARGSGAGGSGTGR